MKTCGIPPSILEWFQCVRVRVNTTTQFRHRPSLISEYLQPSRTVLQCKSHIPLACGSGRVWRMYPFPSISKQSMTSSHLQEVEIGDTQREWHRFLAEGGSGSEMAGEWRVR